MTVTKELLESLGIVSVSVVKGGMDSLCFLRKVNGNRFEFSFPYKAGCSKGDSVKLKIQFKDGEKTYVAETPALVSESGEDYIAVSLSEALDSKVQELLKSLALLEWQDEKYGRRKEERIHIGKENFFRFGLSTPEQMIFGKNMKFPQPCAVLDVSFHGLKIITPMSPHLKPLDNFKIKFSFFNPDETMILDAHRVHSKLNRAGEKVFATISCQLLEPIHHSWKGRIIGLMEAVHNWGA